MARLDLGRAMARLSDGERAAIVACYYQDLSHEEAALALGIPLGTVKTHVLKGKNKLRAMLPGWETQS
jgi:RNA polymerase sigma-70 factor (ECF subfamily)